jgi:hypothetical protein
MKANEGSGCIPSQFGASALDVRVWKPAGPGCFTPAKYSGKHLTGGWLGARAFGRVLGNLLALACLELHLPRSAAYTVLDCVPKAIGVYLEIFTVLYIFKGTTN